MMAQDSNRHWTEPQRWLNERTFQTYVPENAELTFLLSLMQSGHFEKLLKKGLCIHRVGDPVGQAKVGKG